MIYSFKSLYGINGPVSHVFDFMLILSHELSVKVECLSNFMDFDFCVFNLHTRN